MSIELTRKQDLVVWKLLITGEEPMMSKLKPNLTPTERAPLVEQGLIRLEKRGRAQHIVLEDSAWDWVTRRIQSEDFNVSFPATATTAIPAFQALLVKLAAYLRSHDIPLSEFLVTVQSPSPTEQPSEPLKSAARSLEARIREAYSQIPESQSGFRVRLSKLRQNLGNLPPDLIDETLRQMQRRGELSLMGAEDLQEVTRDDEKAAIDLGSGDKRYFIYLK